jgi:L-lysine 6-transaminase
MNLTGSTPSSQNLPAAPTNPAPPGKLSGAPTNMAAPSTAAPAASSAAATPSLTVGPDITVPAGAVFPTLKHSLLVDGFHIVVDLERSRGSVMVGAVDGKRYLDCYSYFASLPVGHNHPGLEHAGFRASLLRAALSNPANSDVYTAEFAAFAQVFREVAMPKDFIHLFLVAGGSLAVENAMKAAFDWKVQLNRSRGLSRPDGSAGGDRILHFREAFHGRSGYALSVTNTDPVKTADFPKFDWPRITNPKLRFPGPRASAAEHAASAAEAAAAEAQALREIDAAFAADPLGIAAILIEPIQGEGGDNHFRPEFLQKLRVLADERDALLIFDEVQTGIGATGTMWAWQQLGVTPDLVCFGKKTQVCGFMSTARIDTVPTNVFHISSRINSTWGGNLVDMVRAARYLQIIRDEQLVANAAAVGAGFHAALEQLAAEFPAVTNVRGRGLMLALDLPDTAQRNALRTRCWDAGLATLACGSRSMRFRPALTFSAADVQQVIAILRDLLRTAG